MNPEADARKFISEIAYEEYVIAARELVKMINEGYGGSAPWPYRTRTQIRKTSKGRQPVNRWTAIANPDSVIVRYKPGTNQAGKQYSQWVVRKGRGISPSQFEAKSIYKTEIAAPGGALNKARDDLMVRLVKRTVNYFKIQTRNTVDQHDGLSFKYQILF